MALFERIRNRRKALDGTLIEKLKPLADWLPSALPPGQVKEVLEKINEVRDLIKTRAESKFVKESKDEEEAESALSLSRQYQHQIQTQSNSRPRGGRSRS